MEDMAYKKCCLCEKVKSTRSFDISPKTTRAYPRCRECRKAVKAGTRRVNMRTINNSKRWCIQCHGRFTPQSLYQKCCSLKCDEKWEKVRLMYAEESPKQIYVYDGISALVDAEDYEYLAQFTWYIQHGKNVTYTNTSIIFNGRAVVVSMQNMIAETPESYVCDHRNHDGMDNRKQNLRVCTQQQNTYNQRPQNNCYSNYKGVSKHGNNKWRAYIAAGGYRHLGVYKNEIDAARAYDKAAKELFGEYAYLNLPNEALKAS